MINKQIWGRTDTSICMAESFSCSPETITALLIGYIPIQNKKLKKGAFPDFKRQKKHILLCVKEEICPPLQGIITSELH